MNTCQLKTFNIVYILNNRIKSRELLEESMNSRNSLKLVGFFGSLLLMLSSCNRVIDWGSNNFKEANIYAKDFIEPVQGYFRSESVYNKLFTSIGQFTALLLTGNVRKIYVDYHALKNSLNKEEKKLLLDRLIDENNHFISFYVTGEQPIATYSSSKAYFTGSYEKQGSLLGTSNPMWKPYLQIDGVEYKAHHVKKVDLSTEYKKFFGEKISQFKETYLVIFDAQIDNNPHDFALTFRSGNSEITLNWKQELYEVGAPIKKRARIEI
jgi:hypothetical protein